MIRLKNIKLPEHVVRYMACVCVCVCGGVWFCVCVWVGGCVQARACVGGLMGVDMGLAFQSEK